MGMAHAVGLPSTIPSQQAAVIHITRLVAATHTFDASLHPSCHVLLFSCKVTTTQVIRWLIKTWLRIVATSRYILERRNGQKTSWRFYT